MIIWNYVRDTLKAGIPLELKLLTSNWKLFEGSRLMTESDSNNV
jgi:hypothetical protein